MKRLRWWGRWSWRSGAGGWVTGDGIRTVSLSFKSAVKLVQSLCQAQVVNGVGGFRFVAGDLSRAPPDRSRVIS